MIEYGFPFHTRQKTGPTPTSQSGFCDRLNDSVWVERLRLEYRARTICLEIGLVAGIRYIRQETIVHATISSSCLTSASVPLRH